MIVGMKENLSYRISVQTGYGRYQGIQMNRIMQITG